MGLVSFSNVYLNETIMTKTLAQTFPVAVVEAGQKVSKIEESTIKFLNRIL